MKLLSFFQKAKDYVYYSLASIKNRYPLKIVKYAYLDNFNRETIVTFSALKQTNIRSRPITEVLDDPLIVEKFHPGDCVKLGFLSAGDLLLKDANSVEEIKQRFNKIVTKMFQDK